ncbi:hypothetical protein Tco_0134800, partial [Tanacetum coccineum]
HGYAISSLMDMAYWLSESLIFKISSFKLQNACLLLIFTKYSIITTFTPVLDTQKADEPVQSSSVSSDFTSKLLNLENPSPADNEIASLTETSALHAMAVPKNTCGFTKTIPLPPPVTNLEKDLSEIKQVEQYAQALFSIPAIVDRYRDNKLREAINKANQAHNLDCKQEAHDEKNAYIELVDTSMRALIKEKVKTQRPQILPQAISNFTNPVIEKNVTESVEATILTRFSTQPTSTYEAAASLFEFELIKILIDKMEKNKSYDKVDYKKKLYDALVVSYNTDKYLFDSYGEGGDLSRRYSTSVTKTKAATSHWGPKRQCFYGFAANMSLSKDVYSKQRIIAVTRLSIMKKYTYGHLEEVKVRRKDQKLHKFREGDFPRLRLQDIEDMLLLLVQKKLTNLTIDEWSNLINRTTYIAYSDPKRVTYKDQMNRNQLMRADELHKFSDGTLDDIRSALNDIAKGIRMEYLPKRKWSGRERIQEIIQKTRKIRKRTMG